MMSDNINRWRSTWRDSAWEGSGWDSGESASLIIKYLLRDTFSSGTLTSPRASDVGYLEVVNAGGAMSIDAGTLLVNGTLAASDRIVGATDAGAQIDYGRVLGRMMRFTVSDRTTMPVAVMRFGFSPSGTSTDTNIGFDYQALDRVRIKQTISVLRTIILGTNEHRFLIVMGNTHSKVIAQNGADTPKLLWVYTATAAANFAKMIATSAVAHNFRIDDYCVFDTVALGNDFSDAVIKNITPVSGTIVSGTVNSIVHLSFTLPGSPSANLVAVELRYRVQDASNYFSLRIVRNAGNTAWDLLLVRVLAGTPSTLKTVTGVATPTRLIAAVSANAHESWTDASGTSTLRGSTITDANLNTQSGIAAVWDVSTTISALSAWDTEANFYAAYF